MKKASTWELLISHIFTYGKVASFILFMISNVKLATFYGIFCFTLWLILSHPQYRGPSKIIKVNTKD